MILCGLMPLNRDLNKPDVGSLNQLSMLCDVTILLDDNSRKPLIHDLGKLLQEGRKIEVLRSDHSIGHWNDYVNRLTLLARSCAYGSHWVLWMDDDDLLEEGVTREFLNTQI